ncbi:hypothetical protein [Vibrio diabolicus]|uniref:hypothetical protein n=1 Tax=Vibrio diabolicus TaxID=50719 RepID=UPI00215DE508|nr:hypothetical protein [Vibrio diabolicus]MCS0446010.1 hypothetical protein [Vibrio diabolicus]
MKLTKYRFVIPLAILFSSIVSASELDQENLCSTNSWKAVDNVNKCKSGQKIAFLPNSFGNEQLPILFIALNCDVRYSVSLTNGGAVCVFNPVQEVIEVQGTS